MESPREIRVKKEIEALQKRVKKLQAVQKECHRAKKELTAINGRLQKALHVKADFTSVISHELRTPLAAVKEGIMIVLDGTAGKINEDQRIFLQIAQKNADRLVMLITDILDFQQLEKGKMEFRMEDEDPGALVRKVCDISGPLIRGKGLELIVNAPQNLPLINVDKDRVMQALASLVKNAVKYTETGAIRVTCAKKGKSVIMTVADTGVGIKGEDHAKIFEGFNQLEKTLTRKAGGVGLGLAISRKIIEAHRGEIRVVSQPGKGSSFSILLPACGIRRGKQE
ncbi:MAG: HAMP domain-containing sensor histidine kinase [Candidatus Omnitrophota bacterium]